VGTPSAKSFAHQNRVHSEPNQPRFDRLERKPGQRPSLTTHISPPLKGGRSDVSVSKGRGGYGYMSPLADTNWACIQVYPSGIDLYLTSPSFPRRRESQAQINVTKKTITQKLNNVNNG